MPTSLAATTRRTIAGAPPANVVYHPTDKFKLTANYSHTYLVGNSGFRRSDQPGDARAGDRGRRYPRDTYYGAVNRDFTKSTQDMGHARCRVEDQRPCHARKQISREQSAPELHRHDSRKPERQPALTAPYSSTFDVLLGLRPAQRAKPLRAGGRHQRPAPGHIQIRHGRNPPHGDPGRRVLQRANQHPGLYAASRPN